MDIKAIIINYYNVAFKITETEHLLLVKQAEIKQTVDDREKKNYHQCISTIAGVARWCFFFLG